MVRDGVFMECNCAMLSEEDVILCKKESTAGGMGWVYLKGSGDSRETELLAEALATQKLRHNLDGANHQQAVEEGGSRRRASCTTGRLGRSRPCS